MRETRAKRRCALALVAACCLVSTLLLRGATLWGAPGMDPRHQTVPTRTPTEPAPTEPGGEDDEEPGPGTPSAQPSIAPTSSARPTASPQTTELASATPLPPTTAPPSPTAAPTRIAGWDFGDAQDPAFPSLLESDGARHLMVGLEWLGERVDQELDSQQVDADLYDDGVEVGELLTCQKAGMLVKVSVANRDDPQHTYDGQHLLYLNVVVDWDGSGSWGGTASCPDGLVAPEWAIRNLPIDASSWPQGVTSTVLPLEVVVGPHAGAAWVRLTLTYGQVVSGDDWDGTGAFAFGETEDYVLTIHPSGETTSSTASATTEPIATATPDFAPAASLPAGVPWASSPLCPVGALAIGGGLAAIWLARRRRRAG